MSDEKRLPTGPAVPPHARAEPGEACSNCRFWRRLDSQVGECRRRAPHSNPAAPAGSPERFGLFPLTVLSAWCGEHAAR